MPKIEIIQISLHRIDILKKKVGKRMDITPNSSFTEYVETLIDDMYQAKSRHKAFKFESDQSEVANQVVQIEKSTWKKISRGIAKRLHRCETATQERVKQIQTLKRGSLLQLLVNIDDQKTLIITKIDHDSYWDEVKLKKNHGLPDTKRTQKTGILTYDNDVISSIKLSDSNATISKYWREDFFEVSELNSSESNTINAFSAIDKVLQKNLKTDYKFDYWTLRNAVLSYFRTSESFTIDNLVNSVFEEFKPDNPNLEISKLKETIISLPKKEKGGFDSQFSITHSAIKAKMINRQIPLANNLELSVKGDIKDLKKLIIPGKENNGREFIQIYSKNGYDEFKRYLEEE